MHQNIKEYNLINSIINNVQTEQKQVSKEGPQLLLENDTETQNLERAAAEDKIAKKKARETTIRKNNAENAALKKVEEENEEGSSIDQQIADTVQKLQKLQKIKKEREEKGTDTEPSIDEDCPHTDGHDHNEDYCAMVKSQLSKLGQMSGMIHSMIPKGVDLPSEVKEKISSAVSSLSGAAAAMQSASSKQDDEEENKPAGMATSSAPRRIATFNVRPVSAPQRMAGFSFNPPSTQNYEEYND